MFSLLSFLQRVRKALNPPPVTAQASDTPIRFGILGAAAIAPPAIVKPVKNHPETVLYAIAARDKDRAVAFAKKHGVERAYGGPSGYQELLDDPMVDAVYNPLPNGLHYEWTMKALAAGKHVLLEKPAANTEEETREMFDLAEKKGLVLLEAFHYRFHPSIQRVKQIIDSRELGPVKNITSALALPAGAIPAGDIRYDYSLGGGGLMDMGCYTLNCIRYLASSDPVSVISATHDLRIPGPSNVQNVDRATIATLALPNDVTATLKCDLSIPWKFGIVPSMPNVRTIVECEAGKIEVYNFVMPTLYHYITVTKKDERRSKERTEKIYTFADAKMEGKGEDWWTTYRYQLQAFIDRVKGRTPQTWVTKEDSVANMHWIEEIYKKTGLGTRPKSAFVLSES